MTASRKTGKKMPDNRTTDDSYKTSEQFQDKDSDADPEMLDRGLMIDNVQKK
jgi:hypothetical protein